MKQIVKRDGRIVDYDPVKIINAIWAAVKAVGGTDYKRVLELTKTVEAALNANYPDRVATVEQVQDQVEKALVEAGITKLPRPISSIARNGKKPGS